MRRLARRRGKIAQSNRRGCPKCAARKAKADKKARRQVDKAAREKPSKKPAAQAEAAPAPVVTPAPVGKKAAKALRKADKQTAKAIKKGEYGAVTPGNAKKIIGIAKIVGPVLAPFALRAASSVRASYDRSRARKLGVPVADLGSFTGHGAALHARIAGDSDALRDLRKQATDEQRGTAETYAEQAEARLAQLTSAVRAAERMPAQRRRSAHRAVDQELGRLESELLTRFGVPTA
ncbi:DUF6474 family protein [Saccharopolyspora mangrovi]|uniref:DUF6474 family protein n=1 Tax=Saccharopolyspora mangrovi TaxID=3082379 RepID=A0ABU6AL64_9PSEU|nr:DUF6474 family protein [Saccharopolyspora sp. S2-29]MEB3372045.1 DUF6474 family protein [Saccharopolyspora sp. S2-29]